MAGHKTNKGKPIAAFPFRLRYKNAPGAIRTHGPRIRNPVLYPPELRGRIDILNDACVLLSLAQLFVSIVNELGSIEASTFQRR
jgi:hypothetical protein